MGKKKEKQLQQEIDDLYERVANLEAAYVSNERLVWNDTEPVVQSIQENKRFKWCDELEDFTPVDCDCDETKAKSTDDDSTIDGLLGLNGTEREQAINNLIFAVESLLALREASARKGGS